MIKIGLIATVVFPLAFAAQAQQTNTEQPTKQQEGTASYVNKGLKEGSGETTKPGNTAASRDLPIGSTAKVTNENTGKSTDVEITGRGPMRKDRQIDVSKDAAKDLGMEKSGVAPTKIEPKDNK